MSDITINAKVPSVNVTAAPQSNVITPKIQIVGGGASITVDDALSLTSENPVQNKVITSALNEKAPIIINTASGEIASIPDGADDMPMRSLVANIEPVQDLHGYDAPWPAGGGKNKLQVTPFAPKTMNGVTVTYNDDGTITVNGTSTGRCYQYLRTYSDGWFPEGKTYTFKMYGLPTDGSSAFLNFSYSENGNTYSGTYGTLTGNKTKTITSSHKYNSVLLDIPAGQIYNNNKVYIYAEEGNTASETWTPYSNICPISGWTGANIYQEAVYDESATPKLSISWESEAGTVYGGSLDVTSGVLTVDRAMVDLGTLSYAKSSTIQNGFVATGNMPADFPLAPSSSAVPNWLCSQYKVYSNNGIDAAGVDGAIAWRVSASNKGVIVRDSNYSEYYTNNDMTSFKAAMSGVQLVYELAEPITYQLTPEQVSGILSTLYGQNNIWADTGDVEVKYPADTKLYIDNLIASLSS